MVAKTPKRLCLYCGTPTKKGRKGEHIVPEAIGGGLTLNDVSDRVVCAKCNSGVLSQIDRELCSRSYLSVVASQQIDAHLWQAWDVDHAADHLLVEARPLWAADEVLNSLVCYPQITFERNGPQARGDYEEVIRFGQEDFAKVLFKAVRHCYGRYRDGKKGAIHFERIQSGVIYNGYRLAPRIFTRHSIAEIAANIREQSFILRFTSEDDKQFALYAISRLSDSPQVKGWSHKLGSRAPTFSVFFDVAETLRALLKLGLNLVAAYCPNTPVNHQTFARAVRIIRGGTLMRQPNRLATGFVLVEDLQCIKGSHGEHSFRLVHVDGVWHSYSSFFGGRIGTYVRIPGPNHEEWNTADIAAPIRSKAWRINTSPILQPVKVRVEWSNSKKLSPSLKLQNSVSSMRVDVVRKKGGRKESGVELLDKGGRGE